jgi:hypothetical protein
MVQTSFGFSGRFWPSAVPCSRVRAGKGRWGFRSSSSSPMPAPSNLSAGSPSTGCDNLPGKHSIAPKTVISGGNHTLPGSPSDLRRFPAPTNSCRPKNRNDPGKYEMGIRGDHPVGQKC